MELNFPEECQKYIDLQCNGDLSLYTDFPEHKRLLPYLCRRGQPDYIMDIGAGIGRASVWLAKKMGWEDSVYILVDGNSGDTQYDEIRTKQGEYYNSWDAAFRFCKANGLDVIMCLPEDMPALSFKFDLVYSFLAVGFHWPLEFYLHNLCKLCEKGCLLVFGIRGIEKKEWVMGQIEKIDQTEYKILDLVLKEKATHESLLLLEKK